ncbi:hypothetical protein TNCV_2823661 [Trichonephila clavipes]|nr:hypothetical protein TNCV_2823661 [Trichonephila clavipes]
MTDCTNSEKADTYLAYGTADFNVRSSQRLHAPRYLLRRSLSKTMFAPLNQQLLDIGSSHKVTRNRNQTTRMPVNKETVLGLLEITNQTGI